MFLARVSGQSGPGARSPCRLCGPALTHAVANLLRIEAHQLHERLIAEQQVGQGIDALNPKQRLQPVEQDILDEGHHRAVDAGAAGVLQQRHHPEGLQELKEIIQHRPFVQPVHPVHNLFPVQAPRNTRIVTAGHFPTHAFGQILRHLIPGLLHDPPPSAASECPSAIEESGPQIKASAYVGISEVNMITLRETDEVPAGLSGRAASS